MNKACENSRLLLSGYLDSALSEPEREAVEQHLSQCSDCRALLKQYREIAAVLRTIDDEIEPPEHFAEGVMDKIRTEKRRRRRRLSAVAACAAVALVTLSLLPRIGISLSADDAKSDCSTDMAASEYAEEKALPKGNASLFGTSFDGSQTIAAGAAKSPSVAESSAPVETASVEADYARAHSVIKLYGAERRDYLIADAQELCYDADGVCIGYLLPMEKLEELTALLDQSGAAYEVLLAEDAQTFYLSYEGGEHDG